MRGNLSFRKTMVLFAAAIVAAGVAAAVGSARPEVVDTTAKIAPKPLQGLKQALYKTSFVSKKGTMNKVTSVTTFPTGYSILQIQRSLNTATCTPSGVTVTCSWGNLAQGAIVSLTIKVQVADVAEATVNNFPTIWQFKDMGGGQPAGAESYDAETVTDSATVYPSGDASVSSDCLESSGGLTASLGDASISFNTPGPGSLLCLPLGLQVSPAAARACYPGRTCTSELLTSFAGATFTAGTPAVGTLVFATFTNKFAPVVFNDGLNPPKLVPLCANVTLSTENPACEFDRSFAGGVVTVFVRWLGNDPFWNM